MFRKIIFTFVFSLVFAVCFAAPEYEFVKEEDTNGDGKVDKWSYMKDNQLVMQDVDMTGDAKADSRKFFKNGRVYRSMVIATPVDEEKQDVNLDNMTVYPIVGRGAN